VPADICDLAKGTAMQKAFSVASMTFDHAPGDAELTALLGDGRGSPIVAVETDGVLTVRPIQLRMKYMVPWTIFTMTAITCMAFFMEHWKPDVLVIVFLALGWLVALPVFLAISVFFSRSIAKAGDCFKVDLSRRTLELCRAGRTAQGSEIIAIVLLSRWYRRSYVDGRGPWQRIFQTGVLLRGPDSRMELYPLVYETNENTPAYKRSKWADRLVNIFPVPLRRIELSKSESQALNDC
jgi:hypothetical protein